MKKIQQKILVIGFIFIILMKCMCNTVYGGSLTDSDIWLRDWSFSYEGTGVHTSSVVSDLQNYYGYEGTELYTTMKLNTQMTIKNVTKSGWLGLWGATAYNVTIGTGSGAKTLEKMSEEEAKEIFGKETLSEGDSCDVVLIVSCQPTYDDYIATIDGTTYWICSIYINEIYYGEDGLEEAESIENSSGTKIDVEIDSANEVIAEGVETVAGAVSSILTFAEKMMINPAGTIGNLIADLLRNLFDAIQSIFNLFQTVTLHTATDIDLVMYHYQDLIDDANGTYSDNDESDGNRDQYTKVSTSYEEDDSQYEYVVEINEDELVEDEDDYLFEDTKVPVIPIELYNMAVGNIDIFDVNFLTGQDEGNENSVWLVLRAIVSRIVHIILYVSAALLITLLIWHGIQLVLHSMDGATARAKHEEGINRLTVSFAMLVGSVLIMAICIFASQAVFDTTSSDLYDYSSEELPIRVHVKLTKKSTDEYSFSTNITGFVRFMAEIENPDRCTEKWGYVLLYIIIVIVNCVMSLVMFVRMIIMWGLSMLGPLLAVFYAMNIEDKMPMKYATWAKIYVLLSMIQVVIALIYKIILVTMFTS